MKSLKARGVAGKVPVVSLQYVHLGGVHHRHVAFGCARDCSRSIQLARPFERESQRGTGYALQGHEGDDRARAVSAGSEDPVKRERAGHGRS